MRLRARVVLSRARTLIACCTLASASFAAPAEAPASAPPPPASADPETSPPSPPSSPSPPTTPPSPDAVSPPPVSPDEAAKKEEAKQLFLKGLELAKSEDLDGALVEFLASNETFPTRVATLNAARTLLHLKRYTEALENYEKLVTKWASDLRPEEKKAFDGAITKLHDYVGTVTVQSDPPGATVVIDAQERGTTPLSGPVRLDAGTHTVRAFKEGYAPFETQLKVLGNRTKAVSAVLRPLTRSGRLRVVDVGGRSLDVVVDGAVVGKSPWEGALGIGSHTVLLRGQDQLGTTPSQAEVKEGATVTFTLTAVKLDATLRVEPTPSNARVAFDGVTVGNGVWEGPVTSGKHKVEVFAPGFLGFNRDVTLVSGKPQVLRAELRRNPDDPIWGGFRPHVYLEALGGLAVAPSFGGSASEACSEGDCSKHTPPLGFIAGARGGYELARGLGLEIFVGFLTLRETMTRKQTASADAHVQSLVSTDYEDATRLTGPMAALSASYQLLDKTPITFRIWGGVARMKATFGNGGTFAGVSKDPNNPAQSGKFNLNFDLEETNPNVWVPFVGPEARVGVRLTDAFMVDVGLTTLFMFPPSTERTAYDGSSRAYPFGELTDAKGNPKFKYPDGTPIPAPGQVELPHETGFGTTVAFMPTVGARYDF